MECNNNLFAIRDDIALHNFNYLIGLTQEYLENAIMRCNNRKKRYELMDVTRKDISFATERDILGERGIYCAVTKKTWLLSLKKTLFQSFILTEFDHYSAPSLLFPSIDSHTIYYYTDYKLSKVGTCPCYGPSRYSPERYKFVPTDTEGICKLVLEE